MEAEFQFNVGDLVQLKSGSPIMTIEKRNFGIFSKSITYLCSWFADGKFHHKSFAENAIKVTDIDE